VSMFSGTVLGSLGGEDGGSARLGGGADGAGASSSSRIVRYLLTSATVLSKS